MSDRTIPTTPGWWWASYAGGPVEPMRVLVRCYSGEPDGFCVDDGDGLDVEDPDFDWLDPVATPAEVDALRAEVAELRATLAAERGDPEGALPGWEWLGSTWHGRGGVVALRTRNGQGWVAVVRGILSGAPTARDAMRAADAARDAE